MNYALEMLSVSKRFPGVTALESVDFSARAGEVVALIGENGAGKSTLVKILCGLHSADKGQVSLAGKPVLFRSPRDAAGAGVAMIHQEVELIDNLDVAGNIFLGRERCRAGWFRLLDAEKMAADAHTYLARVGLSLSPAEMIAGLSVAQRQLVEIARALSCNARVLIMDEPTSSLTFQEADTLLDIVKELSAQGVTVIYISHRLQEIARVADRVVALRDGRNAGELQKDEISSEAMIQLMVGRKLAESNAASGQSDHAVRLAVRNLRTQRYPEHAVSFDLRRGEILGLAGLVGAGRTELVRVLFGVGSGRWDSIRLDDTEIAIDGPGDAIASGIYLVPEDRRACGIIAEMTIRENVTLPSLGSHAVFGWILRYNEQATARQACEDLRVRAVSSEELAGTLSGGNQQKVVLARWLSMKPKVMLFDEPTRGIDIGAKAEIYRILRELAQEGVAILLVSSDMEEVLALSDRVAVMHEGKLTGVLDRHECSPEAVMRLAVA